MEFKQTGYEITATADGHWAGEISFPAVPGSDHHVVIERTFVVPQFRHQGLGSALVARAVSVAQSEHLVVKLMCPFAKAEFRRHPDYQTCLLPADRLD